MTVVEEVAAIKDAGTTGTVAVVVVVMVELVEVGGLRPLKSRSTSLFIAGWFNNERSALNP